jgi:hypothetical protein
MLDDAAATVQAELDHGPNIRNFPPRKPPNGERKSTKAPRRPANDEGEVRTQKAQAKPWPLLTYGEALTVAARPYLVKGLLDRGAFSVWYGKPKAGKSFVVLDLALHIASGRPWRGHRVTAGRVLYLSVEGGLGITNRLVAAQRKFGDAPLPFHVLPVPLDLLGGDGDRLLDFVKAANPGTFDLIVLDTLSRAMPGADESASVAMTALIGVLDRIRAETGAHILAVHHCGLSRTGARGHSSLPGAYDLGVEIEAGAIRVTENREGPGGSSWSFALDVVELGTDADGDPITSCIVRELGEPPAARQDAQARPLGAVEKVVLDCVKAAIADHGETAEEAGTVAREIPPRATVVRRSRIDDAVSRYMPERPGNKRREALDRALISLQAKGLLRHVAGWCWLPSHVA